MRCKNPFSAGKYKALKGLLICFGPLPGAGIQLPELCHSRNMGIQAAVYIDDLSGYIAALIRRKIHAHVAYVFRASVTVDHDIAQEDILQGLGDMGIVFRCDDQPRTDAVAPDILLSILEGGGLRQHIHTGLGTGIGCGAQVSSAGSHGADIDDGAACFIFLHIGQYVFCGAEGAPQIALENMIPHLQAL